MSDRSDPGEQSTARLYRAALGEAWAERYLPVFARFDRAGVSGPVWNGAAALFHLGWLVHHRLWRQLAVCSALAATLALAVAALWQLAPGWPLGVKLGMALAMVLTGSLVPGLWGSAWLHAQLRQRVIEAVKFAPTADAACQALSLEARERQRQNTWGLAGFLGSVALAALLGQTVLWRSVAPTEAPQNAAFAADRVAEDRVDSVAETGKPASVVATKAEEGEVALDELPVPSTVQMTAPAYIESADRVDAPLIPSEGPQTLVVTERTMVQREAPESLAIVAPAQLVKSAAPARTPPKAESPSTVVSKKLVGAMPPAQAATDVPDGLRLRVKGFGVAVGMFAVTANAERVIEALTGAALPVISDSVASARGDLTRVRVGPFDRRAQAEAAAVKVKALGLDAQVYAP